MSQNTTPNMIQTPTNTISSDKPCNNKESINGHHRRTKGMPFSALVFTVFFYVCVSYVFNISPLDVMNDSRFLFFLSNTLVMILAADFGAFTSSSSKAVNVYESNGKVPVPCNGLAKLHVATYDEADDMKELIVVGVDSRGEEEEVEEAPQVSAGRENVKLLTYHDAGSYNGCGDVGVKDDEERSEVMVKDGERAVEKRGEEDDDEETSQISDKELNEGAVEQDDDEFSQMSDEELNKRVEEFIWRLKTQIRLQAAGDTD
ncbi:hypothetical protein MLD38_010114 [Melastoma candidum]|uniref:Uncharacterized protein n=1 Tax=Melastoma candidum TaxID=119954 RepID=A0ACB9QZC9_9MYRT|nr:hypothetical protein MLD38_010114 [Melastoma candidum]